MTFNTQTYLTHAHTHRKYFGDIIFLCSKASEIMAIEKERTPKQVSIFSTFPQRCQYTRYVIIGCEHFYKTNTRAALFLT